MAALYWWNARHVSPGCECSQQKQEPGIQTPFFKQPSDIHCSFAYSALACFRMEMSGGGGAFRERQEVLISGKCPHTGRVDIHRLTRMLTLHSE
jgi:hypothetical protein